MYSSIAIRVLRGAVQPCARRPSAGEAVIGEDDVGLSGYAHHHAEEDADLSAGD